LFVFKKLACYIEGKEQEVEPLELEPHKKFFPEQEPYENDAAPQHSLK
jgi:hypothetical protein